MPKPFKRFLIRLLLERAMIFEEEAYRFYENLLRESTMRNSFDLVKKLLAEKLRHRINLEEVQKRGDLGYLELASSGKGVGAAPGGADRGLEGAGDLADIAPEDQIGILTRDMDGFDEICSAWPDPSKLTTRREVLEFALRKEQCALRFYTSMCRYSRLKTAREVFCALGREERRQVQLIYRELKAAG